MLRDWLRGDVGVAGWRQKCLRREDASVVGPGDTRFLRNSTRESSSTHVGAAPAPSGVRPARNHEARKGNLPFFSDLSADLPCPYSVQVSRARRKPAAPEVGGSGQRLIGTGYVNDPVYAGYPPEPCATPLAQMSGLSSRPQSGYRRAVFPDRPAVISRTHADSDTPCYTG